jgi:hypothetical protein
LERIEVSQKTYTQNALSTYTGSKFRVRDLITSDKKGIWIFQISNSIIQKLQNFKISFTNILKNLVKKLGIT